MVEHGKNHNRIFNIARGSELISGIYEPGDVFDGNKIMGPYNKGKGYLPAGALSDGTTTTSYGGGTCQVSSTLYNRCSSCRGLTSSIAVRTARMPRRTCRTVWTRRSATKRRTFAGATTTTSRFASKRTPAVTVRCVC